MKIDFDNPKHETLVNNYDALCKKYNKKGQSNALEIIDAINALGAADTLFDIPNNAYRPHPLKGEWKGYFSIDVTKVYRVIFRPNHHGDPEFRIDNYKSIKEISIIEIFKKIH